MNLNQLRYIREISRNGLNISAASQRLHISQPGISQQLHMLETELGIVIFERRGKRLSGLTRQGEAVVALAERALREIEQIREIRAEFSNEETEKLSIATTHTQARYVLPTAIREFIEQYPRISLQIHQGSPGQIAEWVTDGVADIGIATEGLLETRDLVTLPCYKWNHCIIAPPGLPLLRLHPLTLEAIAEYPVVTYDVAVAGRSRIDEAFDARGLKPRIVLTAIDSDVIKTFVEIGLGIGIVARMAYAPDQDPNLRMRDASHLFGASTSHVALPRNQPLKPFLSGFIRILAPNIDPDTLEQATRY